ncbi:hypothetical protein R3P38DRAFT_2788974 [Favolaschia claudopus]|uniref:Uncharacterized protein n=1 Tax=Favolaschia claudopus TaxID=2862362 RepID=A0AAW0AKT0_9AGAR
MRGTSSASNFLLSCAKPTEKGSAPERSERQIPGSHKNRWTSWERRKAHSVIVEWSLEEIVWIGGETIGDLRVSETQISKMFGRTENSCVDVALRRLGHSRRSDITVTLFGPEEMIRTWRESEYEREADDQRTKISRGAKMLDTTVIELIGRSQTAASNTEFVKAAESCPRGQMFAGAKKSHDRMEQRYEDVETQSLWLEEKPDSNGGSVGVILKLVMGVGFGFFHSFEEELRLGERTSGDQ